MKTSVTLACLVLISVPNLSSSTFHRHRHRHHHDIHTILTRSDPYDGYESFSNGCHESYGPCAGNNNNRGPKTETTYVYRERDGKCVREQVTTKVEDPDACTCVAENSCSTENVVKLTTSGGNTGGVRVNTNRVNVDVNNGVRVNTNKVGIDVGPGGINVAVNRRGRRQADFLDAIFGPPRSGNYASIFDFIPKIDVAVNRHGFLGNRGVNVNIGNGQGIRVGVNQNSKPFFTFGMGAGSHEIDNRDNSGDCKECGGNPPVVKPTRRRVSVTPSPTPRCSTGQVCCRNNVSSTRSSETPTVPPEGSCGRRLACGTAPGKIIHKRGEANVAEYPWSAIILRVLSNGKKEFLCNGALIDQKKILTVAQCVEAFENYPEQIDVRLGEYDLEQEVEPDAFEDHQVSSIRIHPKYDNDTLTNDLAILTLVDYVKNAVHISPVCLPSESEAFESKSCVTTGWGNRQSVLKEFFVDCLGDEECSQRLHRSKLGPYYHLHPSFFCAQSRDQSSCLIDGGGPLVCRRRDSSYALIGLLSWSVDDNSPDMYVRVQQFLNWIQNDAVTTTTQTVRTTRSVEVTSVTEEVHQEEHSSSSTQTSQEVHPSEESQNNNNGVIVPSPAPIPPTADVDENSTGQQEQTEDADKRKKHPFPAEVHDYETK